MIKVKKKVKQSDRLNLLGEIFGSADLAQNYPHDNDECWRRFSPSRLLDRLEAAATGSEPQKAISAGSPLPAQALPKGVRLQNLSDWQKEDELFTKKVKSALQAGSSGDYAPYTGGLPARFFRDLTVERFVGQNNAQENQIYVLRVEGTIEEPIEISWEDNGQNVEIKGLVVSAAENSEAKVFIRHRAPAFDIALYRLEQAKNSRLEFHLLYDLPSKEQAGVCHMESAMEAGSHAKIGLYTPSCHNAKIFTENMLAERSGVEYFGVHAGDHSQVDHDYHIVHHGDYSKSNINFKMALLDNAKGIFWGNTAILPKTAGCEGYQSNKNLILGSGSRIDAIPKLEILTEDVAASHGSATGEISEEQMFYLMSRGLSRLEAQNLLLRGFFEDILHRSIGTVGASDEQNAAPDPRLNFKNEIWEKIDNRLKLEGGEGVAAMGDGTDI